MLSIGARAVLLVLQVGAAQQQGGPAPTPQAIAADTGAMRHANFEDTAARVMRETALRQAPEQFG